MPDGWVGISTGEGVGGACRIVWSGLQPSPRLIPHSSTAAPIHQDDGSTKLVLDQAGVPEDECERTEKGWRNMLFEPMNSMLGGRVIGA